MNTNKMSPEEFAKLFVRFSASLAQEQDVKIKGTVKIEEQEQVVELFRIYFFDAREQEMIEEARTREADDRGF